MSRAVLLPTPGDPFLIRYWAANFATWADRVDELHVAVNGQQDPDVLDYIRRVLHSVAGDKLTVDCYPERTDHGVLLGRLLARTSAETVMLAEDDAYVRQPAAVSACFRQVEEGAWDVVGSPRGSASMSLIARTWVHWPGTRRTASEDEGNGLWPCFCFARTGLLRETDGHFGARRWERGETIAGLGLVAGDDIDDSVELSCDTFVSTAWQLRAAGARILEVPQYRLADAGWIGMWLDHLPSWFHVGSLSSGLGSAFVDGEAAVTEAGTTGAPEWARRIFWWRRFLETAAPQNLLVEQRSAYEAGLLDLAEKTAARDYVESWRSLFAGWVNWDEGARQ